MTELADGPSAELAQYAGRRWDICRGMGDEAAAHALFQMAQGNGAIAADFLGFRDRHTVVRWWERCGLHAHGRDNPREKGHEYSKWPTATVGTWREQYLAKSREQEQALRYQWGLPASVKTGILVCISDLHLGAVACDYARFIDLRDWIRKHRAVRWFLGGDNFDMHVKSGPGSSRDQFCPLNVAIDLLTEDLATIAGQGIAVYDGNHEARIQRAEDLAWSPSEDLAKRLDLPFMGLCGHIIHEVGGQVYRHYHHHGRGAARTDGAKLNTGWQIAATVTDELVTVGHMHIELSAERLRRDVDRADGTVGNISQDLVMCPSFYSYRGYPADRAYSPASLGACAINLSTSEHQLRVTK